VPTPNKWPSSRENATFGTGGEDDAAAAARPAPLLIDIMTFDDAGLVCERWGVTDMLSLIRLRRPVHQARRPRTTRRAAL
jgi:hypothetical protein